jgi:hypothetical protein
MVGSTCASLAPANQQQCLNNFVIAQQTKANANKPGKARHCVRLDAHLLKHRQLWLCAGRRWMCLLRRPICKVVQLLER